MSTHNADDVRADVVLSVSGTWHLAVRASDADFIETACHRMVKSKRMAYGRIKLRKWTGTSYEDAPDIFPPVRGKRGGLIPLCGECPWRLHNDGKVCND